MNEKDKKYFEALHRDRADSAKTLEKPSMRGIKKEVVEKYSDQAHFIYELLQNADDAQATYARFILEHDRLIFAHNGTRHFSVSNPETEDADSENGTLGDINAITSIANSNKTSASIGKFGVGFKAVFQYTTTPYIYDINVSFKIERFIVPSVLSNDFSGRKTNETLFVFPFDDPLHDSKEAYEDISNKLENLAYPLLFLTNLKHITYKISNSDGEYNKDIRDTYDFNGVTVDYIYLLNSNRTQKNEEIILLFTRVDNRNNKYSVGYFLDNDHNLIPVSKPAFCFFPTKEATGLKFIVHAPFLLTDNREGILAGSFHNKTMIECLAKLAADAICIIKSIGKNSDLRLIDDSIVDIIPYDPNLFSDPFDKSRISFKPFYNSFLNLFKTEQIIPSVNEYITSKDAYWASSIDLPKMFSNNQLKQITGNQSAGWAFPSLGRDAKRDNKPLCSFIDEIVKTNVDDDAILKGRQKELVFVPVLQRYVPVVPFEGISKSFIESQPVEWLHGFYQWISSSSGRIKASKHRPLFLNEDNEAVAAFDKNNQMILFLPDDSVFGYNFVNSSLLSNPETRQFFVNDIGLSKPSVKDYIYNKIRPLYLDRSSNDLIGVNSDAHFKILFSYYLECTQVDSHDFIEMIKSWAFLEYTTYPDIPEKRGYGIANTMYIPTEETKEFLETKNSARFIAIEKYQNLVEKKNVEQLFSFLIAIGVKTSIDIRSVEITNPSARIDLPRPNYTRKIAYSEKIIDGCKEIIEYISLFKNKKKSFLLWNQLLSIIRRYNCSSLGDLLTGVCEFTYRKERKEFFVSSDVAWLLNEPWIMNQDGEFVNAKRLTTRSLSEEYESSSEEASKLLSFLKIIDPIMVIEEDDSNLTESQRQKIAYANKLIENGITEEDLEEFINYKKQQESKKLSTEIDDKSAHAESHVSQEKQDFGNKTNKLSSNDDTISETVTFNDNNLQVPQRISKEKKRVFADIANRTQTGLVVPQRKHEENIEEIDQDDYIPHPVNYEKQIEKAKQKSADEIDWIAYKGELQERALSSERYSFEWFNVLLEMENINSNESNSNCKELSISFDKVEREPGTTRTLVLKHPNHYIPHFVEDLADIPLVLHMKDEKRTLIIEVANIKSYTLRVKLKNGTVLDDIDLDSVTSATIDAQSPSFLLEELKKQFLALGYEDKYNMKDNLCRNIEFIFGPPGTGKTTYLARNVLIPIMMERNNRVLVLTPTNKSADVLVERIMKTFGDDRSYEDWLIRFGVTGEEEIEQSVVFKDKTFDLYSLEKSVTITTIARFPYDYFMPSGKRHYLKDINWDYIIIDEASMIPVANIVYPLYKQNPKKFIIAGDPFQIEPITTVDLWKNENIYTLVQLDSFKNPHTTPHEYKVKLLTTQYRSTPEIGGVFSRFAYDGILTHNRLSSDRLDISLKDGTRLSPLNIIKFPVSKYESVYRAKRLQHSSSYQIYSAIFTYEYVCYLSRSIVNHSKDSSVVKIGVIAPYRAQADLIDKLISSEKMPDNIEVQVGTIHSFQGDECNIVFSVFNPPPSISKSKDMFLNKKNIINVSISRARDYLFIVMPDDNTENVSNLSLIKQVEWLFKKTDQWGEQLTPDLERTLFGQSNYLENNVFSTSHQSVNVYSVPEKRYEVRTEEYAVDIQIHKDTVVSPSTRQPLQIKEDNQIKDISTPVAQRTFTKASSHFDCLFQRENTHASALSETNHKSIVSPPSPRVTVSKSDYPKEADIKTASVDLSQIRSTSYSEIFSIVSKVYHSPLPDQIHLVALFYAINTDGNSISPFVSSLGYAGSSGQFVYCGRIVRLFLEFRYRIVIRKNSDDIKDDILNTKIPGFIYMNPVPLRIYNYLAMEHSRLFSTSRITPQDITHLVSFLYTVATNESMPQKEYMSFEHGPSEGQYKYYHRSIKPLNALGYHVAIVPI